MKGFSNQLFEKHRYLKCCFDGSEVSPEKGVRCELDKLISVEQFLSVTGVQASTTKVKFYCW